VGEEGVQGLLEFESACKETCKRVLECLALGLEVEEKEWFSGRHGRPSGSIVRLLRYPGGQAKGDIGAGAHSDYGSVTLLFQREGQRGLEVLDPEGRWKGVEVRPRGDGELEDGPPPIVVNVGDLLSYWTNGLLKSTVHRVVMPQGAGEARYSIVYFCHPKDDEGLVAVPSRLVEEKGGIKEGEQVGYGGGSEGKALTAKEHLMRRLEATYGSRK
jgi:isopenicillin N synthase-like dioxygenase